MGTTADKLGQLIRSKAAIRTAIISSGVDIPSTEPFKNYAYFIEQIATIPETTPIQDVLCMCDIINDLGIRAYEEYIYTAEDIIKLENLVNLIVEGE